MGDEMLIAALEYRKMGFSIFPVNPKDKKPAIPSWLKYQTEQASVQEITEWFGKMHHQGIAIVTGKLSNILVVDFDKYKPEFSEETALQYFPDSIETPTVKTMSGGQHLYFKYPDQEISIRAGILPGIDYRCDGGYVVAPPTKNAVGNSYRWVIDLSTPTAPLPTLFLNIIKNNSLYTRTRESETAQQSATDATKRNIWDAGVRDENLYHVAQTLANTGNGESYIMQTLAAITKSWGETDEKWINAKVQSAFKRIERKQVNYQSEVEKWVSVTDGNWSVTECNQALQSATKEAKSAVRMAVHRLVKSGLIEKVGERDGVYCKKDTSCEKIDFLNADTTPFDILWPFKIEHYVKLYQKSIIIVAGEPNAGKTAFLLNVARKNMNQYNIKYFSSEMFGAELNIRLTEFGEPLESWTKIDFRAKTNKFKDVIDPNGFNIVDYLEIYKDFYEIGGLIAEIFDSLKTGIAIIAIQKPKGRDEAVGGERTLDKARLFLAVSPGKIKIVKGKVWADKHTNPNGLSIRWTLAGGCKFFKARDDNNEEVSWVKEP